MSKKSKVPTVYIVNSSGHNYEPASRFGRFSTLTEGRVNIFSTERLLSEFKRDMDGVTTDDCILLSGNAILNILAAIVMLKKTGAINLLIYDAARREYVLREITEDVINLDLEAFRLND